MWHRVDLVEGLAGRSAKALTGHSRTTTGASSLEQPAQLPLAAVRDARPLQRRPDPPCAFAAITAITKLTGPSGQRFPP